MKEHNEHTITFKHIGVNQLSRDQKRFILLHEFAFAQQNHIYELMEFEKKKRDYLFLL